MIKVEIPIEKPLGVFRVLNALFKQQEHGVILIPKSKGFEEKPFRTRERSLVRFYFGFEFIPQLDQGCVRNFVTVAFALRNLSTLLQKELSNVKGHWKAIGTPRFNHFGKLFNVGFAFMNTENGVRRGRIRSTNQCVLYDTLP
jgi:hypothetical protein